ncbi:pantoate--beta-alanine ligase [Thermodesulfovibrionales bacterium]|nr:pantoate--beta-alanine ligase [Thermodesulfovibrionales bacterium]
MRQSISLSMKIIRSPEIMHEVSKIHLFKGTTIGFVPTMGALHEGHMSLVRKAKSENGVTVVSIFVNPAQFGPSEDFDKYPRTIETDIERSQREGVDILFMPDAESIYTDTFATYVNVAGLSGKLCGAFRRGHFTGVATIICKFFNILMPARAYFGQKDFQQGMIISRLIKDLNINVKLTVCPTVREKDGLAISSRNSYLNSRQRRAATVLYRTLLSISQAIKAGDSNLIVAKEEMNNMLKAEPLISEIQYAGIYSPDTLDEIFELEKENLLATSVRIGDIRLIDNMIVTL